MTFPSQRPQQPPGPPWPPRPAPPQYRPPPPRKSQAPLIIAAAAGALVLVGLVVLGIALSNRSTSTSSAPPASAATEEPIDAGIPAKPDDATRAAYLAELDAIDPDIVHGKPDTAVNRGRDLCGSMKGMPLDQWRAAAKSRFTSPGHPDGFDNNVVDRIVGVVHQRLCPTY